MVYIEKVNSTRMNIKKQAMWLESYIACFLLMFSSPAWRPGGWAGWSIADELSSGLALPAQKHSR